jgi:hypothetical protein
MCNMNHVGLFSRRVLVTVTISSSNDEQVLRRRSCILLSSGSQQGVLLSRILAACNLLTQGPDIKIRPIRESRWGGA